MKIVVSSDWHLDAVTAGVPRIKEFDAYVHALIDVIEKENADVFMHLGDFFDPGGMLCSLYTAKLMQYARMITQSVDRSFWIAGNHDTIETSEGITTISPLVEYLDHSEHDVFEQPTFKLHSGAGFLFLPYTARAAYVDPRVAIEYAIKWRRGNRAAPMVVAGHLTVPGASLGSETYEMSRGRDDDFPLSSIEELEPSIVLAGHYHEQQVVKTANGFDIVIVGSPQRLSFGERDHVSKGCLIVNV